MPEYVSYDDEKQIIRVDSVGDSPTEVWEDSLAKVKYIRAEKPVHGVLVDTRKQETTSDYQSILGFSMQMPNDLPFAILVSGMSANDELAQLTLSKAQFMESAAQLRGVIIRLFTDESKAVKWLLGE